MFEDYLEDAHYFALRAQEIKEDRDARRYFRASVFYSVAAIESFINYIGDVFAQGGAFQAHEVAFLTDKKFGLSEGRFETLGQLEYHRLEEKLRFLICKFVPSFDFFKNPSWSRFIEFKKFRDAIMHPRQDEDEISITEYNTKTKIGLSSIIEIINHLCKGIFKKPLRQKLLDLSP